MKLYKCHVNKIPILIDVFFCVQGILNPMQAFLNTLAFYGWTGLDIDLCLQRHREPPWDSASTSMATAGGYNPMMPSTLLYQSHVQDGKKLTGNGHQLPSDAVSILSESNTTNLRILPPGFSLNVL